MLRPPRKRDGASQGIYPNKINFNHVSVQEVDAFHLAKESAQVRLGVDKTRRDSERKKFQKQK